jgi:hypothetical protein
MTILPEDAADRLAKLLGMLGSSHDGERASAALKADQLVRQHGMTWRDLVFRVIAPALPPPPPRVWLERGNLTPDVALMCLAWTDPLTGWEIEFLRSIGGRRRLTDKQKSVLRRIVEKCGTFAEYEGAD